MHKSPELMTGRFSSLCRRLLPQFLLLTLVLLTAFEAPLAFAGSSDAPSPLFAQTRGRRTWWNVSYWSTTTKIEVGLGGFVLALIALVVYQKTRGEKEVLVTAPSDIIGGYRLQNLMMTGQTSQVWEVVETTSGRHFAMKMLLPEKAEEAEHRKLLFHEANVGIQMAHPNVIKIITLHKEEPPYFVMEFFPAGNLKLRIMHKKWDFIKEKAHDIFKQAATALAYMNSSGWVHRDVKPDNIMVNSAGEVRLIDFALAQKVSKGGMFRKRKGRTAGTRSYMSPEQVRGGALDGRADIYSFGATMYEVVTGRPPFRASTPIELLNKQIAEKPLAPRSINPEVTEECSALILRMLAKKKEDRPRDFHEVLMALRSIKVFADEPASKNAETRAQGSQGLKAQKASLEEAPIECPQCNSTQFSTDTQGFSIGKAAVGGVLIGPVGILSGMIGSGKINITCLKCGNVFKPGQGA